MYIFIYNIFTIVIVYTIYYMRYAYGGLPLFYFITIYNQGDSDKLKVGVKLILKSFNYKNIKCVRKLGIRKFQIILFCEIVKIFIAKIQISRVNTWQNKYKFKKKIFLIVID